MNAGSIASRPPICISPDSTIEDAMKLMASRNIGLLVVSTDCERDIAGVVSERDIVRALASGRPASERVGSIASRSVVHVYTDTPIWEVARLMRRHMIRHIVVLEGGRIYGVISIRDLIRESEIVKRLAEYAEEKIDELTAYD